MEIFVPMWNISGKKWKEVCWIGPRRNIIPNGRKGVNSVDKNKVMSRQGCKCNACGDKICLYPYSNADLDHIIPLSNGGQNITSNYQYLCVLCHRNKTAMENERHIRRFPIEIDNDKTYIICNKDNKDMMEDVGECDPLRILELLETEGNFVGTLRYDIPSSKIELTGGRDIDSLFEEFSYIPN